MNLVEALLQADEKKVTAPQTEDIEIKRLSKLLGEPFIITVSQVSNQRLTEIYNSATTIKRHGKTDTDGYQANLLVMVEGIKTKFNDPELLKKYGCVTVKELYGKLFNFGEVGMIVKKIVALSGVGDEDQQEELEEVKN